MAQQASSSQVVERELRTARPSTTLCPSPYGWGIFHVTNSRTRLAGLALLGGLLAAACGGDGLSADAGEDFTVSVNEAPVFDGCDSTGDISDYRWMITAGPSSDDAGKALRSEMSDCSFTLENAMSVEDVGEWTIELTVTDGATTATDQVTVEVLE